MWLQLHRGLISGECCSVQERVSIWQSVEEVEALPNHQALFQWLVFQFHKSKHTNTLKLCFPKGLNFAETVKNPPTTCASMHLHRCSPTVLPLLEYAYVVWSRGSATKLMKLQESFCQCHQTNLPPLKKNKRVGFHILVLYSEISSDFGPSNLSTLLP